MLKTKSAPSTQNAVRDKIPRPNDCRSALLLKARNSSGRITSPATRILRPTNNIPQPTMHVEWPKFIKYSGREKLVLKGLMPNLSHTPMENEPTTVWMPKGFSNIIQSGGFRSLWTWLRIALSCSVIRWRVWISGRELKAKLKSSF